MHHLDQCWPIGHLWTWSQAYIKGAICPVDRAPHHNTLLIAFRPSWRKWPIVSATNASSYTVLRHSSCLHCEHDWGCLVSRHVQSPCNGHHLTTCFIFGPSLRRCVSILNLVP